LLCKNSKQTLIFLTSLTLIGAIPSVLNQKYWLFFRASFIIPFLIIIAAFGINYLWKYKRKLFYLFSSLYLLLIVNFSFNYFIRYPVFAAENIFFSPRILANYLARNADMKKIVVFDKESDFTFSTFIFYEEKIRENNISNINYAYKKQDFNWSNFTFESCIPEDFVYELGTLYIFHKEIYSCNPTQENAFDFKKQNDPVFIKSIKDSGNDYFILGDKLCQFHDKLNDYINPNLLSEMNFKELSDEEFCQTWITKSMNDIID
jgi:hypothetical protein